jgi:GTPase Era involved in 16S rRNA processing
MRIAEIRINFGCESAKNLVEIGQNSNTIKKIAKKNRMKIVRLGVRSDNDLTLFLLGSLSDRMRMKIG